MAFSKTFKDCLGREWTVNLTLVNLDDFEEVIGPLDSFIPPMKESQPENNQLLPLAAFIGDSRKVFEAFYALVKPAADALKLDMKGVKAGMGTDQVVMDMTQAILRAIHDFFPRDPMRRAMLQRVATMGQTLMDGITEKINKGLEKIDVSQLLSEIPEPSADEINAKVRELSAKHATGISATSA